MMHGVLHFGWIWGVVLAIGLLRPAMASAAPRINNLSLRGLQAGGTTTLVIDGSELAAIRSCCGDMLLLHCGRRGVLFVRESFLRGSGTRADAAPAAVIADV